MANCGRASKSIRESRAPSSSANRWHAERRREIAPDCIPGRAIRILSFLFHFTVNKGSIELKQGQKDKEVKRSMRIDRACLFAAALVVLLEPIGRSATAAALALTPVVAEILQPDLTPFPVGAEPGLSSLHGIPLTARVDFYMEIADLQTGELGFGNTAFDVELRGVAQNAAAPGWQPDVSKMDVNGDLPFGQAPKWYENKDIGPSNLDLASVYAGLFPRAFGPDGVDPRRTLGQSGPEFLGSVYVDWNGSHTALVQPTYSLAGGFSTYDNDLMLSVNAGPSHFGVVQFGVPMEQQSMQVVDWDLVGWPSVDQFERSIQAVGTDVTVRISGDTLFTTMAGSGEAGPHTDRRLGGSEPEENSLNLILDWTDSNQALTTSVEFSSAVSDVGFVVRDVDAGAGLSFVDQVTIVGFLDGDLVLPSIMGSAANEVVANTILGVSAAELSNGDALVFFAAPIDRFELLFGSGAGAPLDPGVQAIALHDIRFAVAVPEPAGFRLALAGVAFVLLRFRNAWCAARQA